MYIKIEGLKTMFPLPESNIVDT